jgi:hypothetical protein
MNAHTVLGLKLGATLDEVKRAYRRLAMRFHPDRNSAGLERMKAINIAYESVLKITPVEVVPVARHQHAQEAYDPLASILHDWSEEDLARLWKKARVTEQRRRAAS